MKTLISYSTSHGCTENTARELKEHLGGEVQLANLKDNPNPELEKFDRIIIGGSIHAGQIQKRVKDFCAKNMDELKAKELGLFICCMEEGENAQKQLRNAFPEELHEVAKSTAIFGGEFDFEKMNFFEKMVVKKVAKVKASTSKIDHQAIQKFSKRMDKIFNPFLFLV
ncbi:flavodoxin domain-containing protein [Maribellus maritimus]|uniref:flavodoxin domain-containing protein n=1 Tax=Maribellus maritimus TaxID=2870838 RepID=UPI001EEBD624|nr:flavodoxin domain-containing protein [Maribellus maritimus]MCG6189152.1 flavodoxin domain-containing protein [Maribellus maritimus]